MTTRNGIEYAWYNATALDNGICTRQNRAKKIAALVGREKGTRIHAQYDCFGGKRVVLTVYAEYIINRRNGTVYERNGRTIEKTLADNSYKIAQG